MAKLEDLAKEMEIGGAVYFKTPNNRHAATLLELNQNWAKIRLMQGGRETRVSLNQLEPDRAWLAERDKRRLDKQQRNAAMREPRPLTHKITIPVRLVENADAPRPAPAPASVPAERLVEPTNTEATRRMVILMQWLAMTRFGGKRGAVEKVKNLMKCNVSGIMRGERMSVENAKRVCARIGLDERYLTLSDFVSPDKFQPAPTLSERPAAPPPPANPTTRREALLAEVRAWREMSPLATVDREIATKQQEVAEAEVAVALKRKELGELEALRKELAAPESYVDAVAE